MGFLVGAILHQKLKEAYDDADQAGLIYTTRAESSISLKKILDLGDQIVMM